VAIRLLKKGDLSKAPEGVMFNELAVRILVAFHRIETRLQDEEGQTLAEYGLIMAVIAVAVVAAAAVAFRGAIIASFSKSTTCLSGSC
jgi:Flp pilus assembly pilin Flp